MKRRFPNCGGLGLSAFAILESLFAAAERGSPKWFRFSNREIIFTYQGRYAIGLLCELLNIGPGDEVIVPSFNCGAEVDPFLVAGANVVQYRVNDRADLDLEDVYRRITTATKLVYVTHFFGWPQCIEDLSTLCKRRGIYLVEDCALSLFTKSDQEVTGDAAIFSFAKFLPVPDGGALVFSKDIKWGEHPFRLPPTKNVLLATLPLIKKSLMQKNPFWLRSNIAQGLVARSWLKKSRVGGHETYTGMLESNLFIRNRALWSMSTLTRKILHNVNPDEISRKRQDNFRYLLSLVKDVSSFHPLYSNLPNNVCPHSFPAVVQDRGRWAERLNAMGVAVGGWPGYHPSLNWDDFPEARALKNNIVALPVHQDLNPTHMEHISSCVHAIAETI